MELIQALTEIECITCRILEESQQPAVRVRLLRDILHKPKDDIALVQAKRNLEQTEWVRLLRENQTQQGYFTRLKSELRADAFMTACDICFDIGLDATHPVLARAKEFAEQALLEGVLDTHLRVRSAETLRRDLSVFERNLAAMLARVEPMSPWVEEVLEKWLTIAGVAFQSGTYDREAQIEATKAIFGPDYTLGHAIRYPEATLADSATLLGSRLDLLESDLDESYVKWFVTERNDILRGLERLSSAATRPSHRSLFAASILLQMDSLRNFQSWGSYMGDVSEVLWQVRGSNGMWSFGSACANPHFIHRIRLSDDWRGKRGMHDWTTRILLLLHPYYVFHQSAATQ